MTHFKFLFLFYFFVFSACGVKGPPLSPLQTAPELEAKKTGSEKELLDKDKKKTTIHEPPSPQRPKRN